MYVIVKNWAAKDDGKIHVFYSTWDGRCICTKQNHNAVIKAPKKEGFEKRDVHIEVLKQIYSE